ncbi:hypothetical protein [Mycobacterium sp. 1274756.6]|uniref:hypothetical protein n=1 Tax=Mycobacterium sp. 1274756.6 TaxID=1834076 RepID=UPI0007FCECC0|nr:hypothetical protein [Mycobacterium sp. 1274756.6]OBJ69687.1 hypothetical protein A5643_11985 [Mycobacterium sp. 1274756.6]
MNKLAELLRRQHRSEAALARRLRRVGQRHQTDHDVYHLCGDLAAWSESHLRQLAAVGEHHGLRLAAAPPRIHRVTAWLRTANSRLLGRRPEPSLLLLAELVALYRQAATVSLQWDLVAQGAQVTRDAELLAVAARCHPQTLRQMRWFDTMAKELSPQTLAS